jgi:type VI secretion system protein ImpH
MMETRGYGWQRDSSVADWLSEEPFRFEFHQAIRILEVIHRRLTAEPASKSEVGVRFCSRVSFEFPASEVQSIVTDGEGLPRVTVNFMGLAGGLGPLPYPYTEMVLEAAARRDFAAADFLDIFNHRLIWLFYRAHKIHHPAQTVNPPYRGQTAQFLFSLIGLGPKPLRDRLGVPDSSLLHYSGLLARNVRTAAGLECLLGDYFGLSVRLRQFAGRWCELDRAQWTAIGTAGQNQTGQNQTIGDGAVLGRRVWNQAGGVIIEIGAAKLDSFKRLLPGEPAYAVLVRLARFYLGPNHRIQVRLFLKSSDVPKAKLGQAKLGYTSWMGRVDHHGGGAAINFLVND